MFAVSQDVVSGVLAMAWLLLIVLGVLLVVLGSTFLYLYILDEEVKNDRRRRPRRGR